MAIAGGSGGVSLVHYGELKVEEVSNAFSCHDLFKFPTRSENFGYVIFETWRAVTPVLRIDQTTLET